jgi:Spy/CpxP family protein refolding chaperone
MKKILILLVIAVAAIGILNAEEDCRKYRGERGEGRGFEHRGERFDHPMGKEHGGPMFHEKMVEELDLTEKQQTEIRKFQTDNKKLMIQKQADIKILKIEIREALNEQNFGEAKRVTEKISDIEKELAVNKIEMHEKRWEMLTDEQKEKAKKLMSDKPMMKKKIMQKHMKGKF